MDSFLENPQGEESRDNICTLGLIFIQFVALYTSFLLNTGIQKEKK